MHWTVTRVFIVGQTFLHLCHAVPSIFVPETLRNPEVVLMKATNVDRAVELPLVIL